MHAFKFTILTAALALTACAGYSPYHDPHFHTKAGAAVGAISGGVLGHQIHDDNGRYVGAAAGALVGGTVGNLMDRQRQTYDQALSEEQRRNQLELERYRQRYSGYQGYGGSQEYQGHQGYQGSQGSQGYPGYNPSW